ncbi:MAG: TIGR00266 family protein, partial [Chloroflexi bacterium]|nr:TIGR00266 family protein [Chloroflexota bacterium]
LSASVSIETGMRGGLLGGLKRSVLGGESFFINTFTAEQSGEVTIAPGLPGDIQAIEMNGNSVLVQSGSFLAATPEIEVDTSWGGAKSFFSGEGLILLRCTGHGLLFLS